MGDTSVGIDEGQCKGDATTLRPTLLAAVPMVFDKIRNGVDAKINQVGGAKAQLFTKMLAMKLSAMKKGQGCPLADKLIFDALRTKLLGGRLRFALCGGGPLSGETQKWMNAVMNVPVGQGWGLTETVGAGTVVWPNDRQVGRVGAPVICSQIKLEDWEEGGYFVKNRQGHMLIGGPNVTMGYYRNEQATKDNYFVDDQGVRWFRTGDVGEVDLDGGFRIIDRKKDLVKLSGGEYISYGALEPLIKDSPFVDNCMVYADPFQSYCVCVTTPPPGTSPSEEQVLKSIHDVFHKNGRVKFEFPKKVYVDAITWGPENDLCTAAMKLKRQNLQKHYKGMLEGMYA